MEIAFHSNFPSLPQELTLVVACLKATWREDEAKQFRDLAGGPIDWQAFVWWADRHRVVPLVYTGLRRIGEEAVPPEVFNELKLKTEHNIQRNMLLAAEVSRLTRLFQEHDVPMIIFKGVVLALKLFGDLGVRYAGDIDLLTPPSQAERAEHVLHEAGYIGVVPDFTGTSRQRDQFKQTLREKHYLKPDTQTKTELHWRLSHYRFLLPFNFEELADRSQTITIAGCAVPILAYEDMWLHLFEHGASHAWFRLFWLCDIAELLYRMPEIDWKRVLDHARKLKIERPLAQGLLLAHLLLGAPLTPTLYDFARRDRTVPYLVRMALRHIGMPEPIHLLLPDMTAPNRGERAINRLGKRIWIASCYETRLHQGFLHKIDVMREFAALRPADWSIVRLPAPLYPVSYFLRPFLWIWRQLRPGAGNN